MFPLVRILFHRNGTMIVLPCGPATFLTNAVCCVAVCDGALGAPTASTTPLAAARTPTAPLSYITISEAPEGCCMTTSASSVELRLLQLDSAVSDRTESHRTESQRIFCDAPASLPTILM